jgi:hypothetical protein
MGSGWLTFPVFRLKASNSKSNPKFEYCTQAFAFEQGYPQTVELRDLLFDIHLAFGF